MYSKFSLQTITGSWLHFYLLFHWRTLLRVLERSIRTLASTFFHHFFNDDHFFFIFIVLFLEALFVWIIFSNLIATCPLRSNGSAAHTTNDWHGKYPGHKTSLLWWWLSSMLYNYMSTLAIWYNVSTNIRILIVTIFTVVKIISITIIVSLIVDRGKEPLWRDVIRR